MAIEKVRVMLNGTWTNLNLVGGKWTGAITAPSVTSHNLTDGYYPVTVEVTNDAGTVITKDATDATLGSALRLVVKETIKPVITLDRPSNGAYVTNNKPPVTFKVVDEAGGSGVDLSSVKITFDGTTYVYKESAGGSGNNYLSKTETTNGYYFAFILKEALSDGSHSFTINASDNDGNAAVEVTSSFTVDTVPPTLTISHPQTGISTNKAALTITGTTNDLTSSPVTVSVTVNGSAQGEVTVATDGNFSKEVTLIEGANSIVVTAKDGAGKTSSVTLSVNLDTTAPTLNSITLSPNPINTGESVVITIEVS